MARDPRSQFRNIRVSPQMEEAAQRYVVGEDIDELADEYGVAKMSIREARRRLGLKAHNRRPQNKDGKSGT